MRKQITFQHSWEIMKWLEEHPGEKLYDGLSGTNYLIKIKDSFRLVFANGDSYVIDGLWRFKEFYIELPPPVWYENIPKQGVLCWVSDYEEQRNIIEIITHYDIERKSAPFKGVTGIPWLYATPVKYEEIKHLLENQNET